MNSLYTVFARTPYHKKHIKGEYKPFNLQSRNWSTEMNIETVRKTIALCSSFQACKCFDRIFALLPVNDSSFNLENIRLNRDILIDYNTQLLKHYNKDLLFKQKDYQTVTASTLKAAFDHHLSTLQIFKRYIEKYLPNEDITFDNVNCAINIFDYIDSVYKLTESLEQTNRTFNNPESQVTTRRLIDEVDFHIYNLQLLDDLYIYVSTNFTYSNGGTTFTRH